MTEEESPDADYWTVEEVLKELRKTAALTVAEFRESHVDLTPLLTIMRESTSRGLPIPPPFLNNHLTFELSDTRSLCVYFDYFGEFSPEECVTVMKYDCGDYEKLANPGQMIGAEAYAELLSLAAKISDTRIALLNELLEGVRKTVQPFAGLLTSSDLAERYGVHRSTIWRWSKGPRWLASAKLPAPVITSKGYMWRESDLDKWDAEQAAK